MILVKQVTKENMKEIADTIIECSGCVDKVTFYDFEIEINNKLYNCTDTIAVSEWIVIDESKIGYSICSTEAEAKAEAKALTKNQ